MAFLDILMLGVGCMRHFLGDISKFKWPGFYLRDNDPNNEKITFIQKFSGFWRFAGPKTKMADFWAKNKKNYKFRCISCILSLQTR